jgi:hypothetical protein
MSTFLCRRNHTESRGETGMTRTIKTILLTITLVSFAMAGASDSVTAAENPCKADVKRLCGDVKPGQGRIQACLKEHKDEISQECKDNLKIAAEKLQKKAEEVVAACKGDAATLCAGVEPGQGRILKCLLQHKEDLSEGCSTSLNIKK